VTPVTMGIQFSQIHDLVRTYQRILDPFLFRQQDAKLGEKIGCRCSLTREW